MYRSVEHFPICTGVYRTTPVLTPGTGQRRLGGGPHRAALSASRLCLASANLVGGACSTGSRCPQDEDATNERASRISGGQAGPAGCCGGRQCSCRRVARTVCSETLLAFRRRAADKSCDFTQRRTDEQTSIDAQTSRNTQSNRRATARPASAAVREATPTSAADERESALGRSRPQLQLRGTYMFCSGLI